MISHAPLFIPSPPSPQQCVNAALTLCEMICISRKSFQLSNPAPLHDLLESKPIVERLLLNMFSSENPSDVVVINGISVLLTLLRERWVQCGVVGWALFRTVQY